MNLLLSVGKACPLLAIVSRCPTPHPAFRTNFMLEVDWSLYGKFVEGAMKLLNIISTISLELLGSISTEPFPPFSAHDIVDSESVLSFKLCRQLLIVHPSSTYDAIMSWLMPGLVGIGVLSRNLLADLQSQRSMERGAVNFNKSIFPH